MEQSLKMLSMAAGLIITCGIIGFAMLATGESRRAGEAVLADEVAVGGVLLQGGALDVYLGVFLVDDDNLAVVMLHKDGFQLVPADIVRLDGVIARKQLLAQEDDDDTVNDIYHPVELPFGLIVAHRVLRGLWGFRIG